MSNKPQSLTPLRFARYHWFESTTDLMNAPIDHPSKVLYGEQQYNTDCGRFVIRKNSESQWFINPRMSSPTAANISLLWAASGLCDAGFSTRREALECLQLWCESEGLV